MKRVCAWCKKKLSQAEEKDQTVTHSICKACKLNVLFRDKTLRDLIDGLSHPVLAVTSQGKVRMINSKASAMLGKSADSIRDLDGGVVMECVYSKLPLGCGKTEHCTGCTIRNTVMKTFATGQDQSQVTAYQYIQMPDGPKKMQFLITTEKVGEIVLLRIDDAREAAED
jgi:DNA-directed RNA polymerase subunit RPC12/RpoP